MSDMERLFELRIAFNCLQPLKFTTGYSTNISENGGLILMAKTMGLSDFLKSKALSTQEESPLTPMAWQERKQKWLKRIDDLYGQVSPTTLLIWRPRLQACNFFYVTCGPDGFGSVSRLPVRSAFLLCAASLAR